MHAQVLNVLMIGGGEGKGRTAALATGLSAACVTLNWAGGLAEGQPRLDAGDVDVVVLDAGAPDPGWEDSLRRLRAQAPSLPVVLLADVDDEALALTALRLGAQDYLARGGLDGPTLARTLGRAAARASGPAQAGAVGRNDQPARELAETTAFLNSILDSSTEYGIIATDLQGNVLTWNAGAQRNNGYNAGEMVGRQHIELLFLPEDVRAGKVKALLEEARRTGKAEGVQQRVRKDGSFFTASSVLTLRRDAGGKPVGLLLISRDVTAQKELEEELRRKGEELREQGRRAQEASRFKSEFLASMSHELRTPLNAVIGFAELMYDGRVGPISPLHREYLGDVLTSARHLLQIINDVLDLAKVEAGDLELRPQALDLAKLVGEVRNVLRSLAARRRVQLETEVDPRVRGVVLDPAKLKQVLYNYLSNALKFTPEEGRVTVRVTPEGDDAFSLEVEDTGIGIRPEDLGRLFVEFHQLDAGKGAPYPGTGMGLALTRRLVEAQGGSTGVRSTPGRGSTFFAVLPRRLPTAPPRPAPLVPGAAPGAPSVLVIEDDARERAWLSETLAGAGYAVETAATGAEAADLCRRRTFDAITLDLLLPDMHPREVLQAVRGGGRNGDVPLLVVTVVADNRAVVGFNVQDYLVKPVQADELLASLHRNGVPPGGSGNVLVVDDDHAALKIMEATLQHLGYRPVCRDGGAAGLEAVARERPDAVILDLMMPEVDGFEFLERLRRAPAGRRLPVLVWTARELSAEDHVRLRAMAQAVVGKGPHGVGLLVQELQQHLQAPRAASPQGASCPAAGP